MESHLTAPLPIEGIELTKETVPADSQPPSAFFARTTPAQIVLMVLATTAFFYFARPVLLPVFLACIAGMTLKPLIGWSSRYHVPKPLSAAIILVVLMSILGAGFVQLGRPALQWMDEAPEHITVLRQRVQKLVPRIENFNQVAAAVSDLAVTTEGKKAEQKKDPTVKVKISDDHRSSILNWTGTLLVGIGETLVLLYLLLASGDLFIQKLVHVMPTWRDKKRAVEINREIQHNISHYLFSVTLINLGLGIVASVGFFFMGVPNAAMWGMVVAILNYVPYFGPFVGVSLLAGVGLLTFDTLSLGLLPPGWYLLLHLLEANLITPILLGRRFTLNAVVIFVSLIFWTWLWGVPGALLSVPILVSIKVVCDRVPTLAPVSELLASGTEPPKPL